MEGAGKGMKVFPLPPSLSQSRCPPPIRNPWAAPSEAHSRHTA
jgi:hypothetical protein